MGWELYISCRGKLTREEKIAIRVLRGRMKIIEIAKLFKVSNSTISKITNPKKEINLKKGVNRKYGIYE